MQRSNVPISGLLKTSQCICIYCIPAGPQEIMGHSVTLCDLLLTTFISNHIQTNKDNNLKKRKVNCVRLVCHLGNGYGREKGTFCLLEKLERQTHDGRDCMYCVYSGSKTTAWFEFQHCQLLGEIGRLFDLTESVFLCVQ